MFYSVRTNMQQPLILPETSDIIIQRKVYDESLLHSTINSYPLESSSLSNEHHQHRLLVMSKNLTSRFCPWDGFSNFLVKLFPIFIWLPKYSIKNDLLADISGGLTVGVMHIPLGKNICCYCQWHKWNTYILCYRTAKEKQKFINQYRIG